METLSALRIVGLLPSLFSLGFMAFAFVLASDRLDVPVVAFLLVALAVVLALVVATGLRRTKGTERIALLVAGSTLLFAALYVRPLDTLALYALLLLLVLAGQFSVLGVLTRPLSEKRLTRAEASEARRTLLAALLRLSVVLLAAFFLSALLWNVVVALSLGATSDLSAFLLAALLILLITLLFALRESPASA
ncbi:MAG: hypothetical protein ACE5JE_02490 [Thermoplasmata archaeon]